MAKTETPSPVNGTPGADTKTTEPVVKESKQVADLKNEVSKLSTQVKTLSKTVEHLVAFANGFIHVPNELKS